jgi:hypothetical protein
MVLRIRSLDRIDPSAMPLPHGTEVVARADRVLPDRLVPEGSVGRVVAVRGGHVDVHIVGVGVVRYERRDLVPRRIGQVRYARRREGAWQSLRSCVVLETIVGSQAWGLADDGSDVDVRGVFVLPLPWTAGLVSPPVDLVDADGTRTYWEVGKAVRQALRADPNTLEMLFVPGARATDEIGEWLLAEREAFVSAEIYGSFGRYALSQLKRLEQANRLAEHRDVLLAWLREDPPPDLDTAAQRLARLDPRASPTDAEAVHRARQYIKQLYRSLHDQGLIPRSEYAAMTRFARAGAADLELARDLRPKNAYNLLRLIVTAAGWLRDGAPEFRVSGPLRGRLLQIKQGRVALAEVVAEAEGRVRELEEAWRTTRLPRVADVTRADALLRRMAEETARRWIRRVPGPLGADAPRPPEAVWEEE